MTVLSSCTQVRLAGDLKYRCVASASKVVSSVTRRPGRDTISRIHDSVDRRMPQISASGPANPSRVIITCESAGRVPEGAEVAAAAAGRCRNLARE